MKHYRKREEGITLIGFLLGLTLVAFAAVMVMKIVPMYTEYYNISKAMDGIAAEAGLANKTNYQIRSALFRRLQTNYVRSVDEKDIHIVRKNGVRVNISYEVRKGLIANLDVVASFDKEVVLSG
ncbi:MAG: DUF4845 domain-containing protein [Gammaproteobacteria bacterium]|nr:MAG: DUF4845 domain-containing protein [Gammaproteobacteria bacterium]